MSFERSSLFFLVVCIIVFDLPSELSVFCVSNYLPIRLCLSGNVSNDVCMCMHVYACVCMCMHVYACVCEISGHPVLPSSYVFSACVCVHTHSFATRKNVHVTLVIHPRKELDGQALGINSYVSGEKRVCGWKWTRMFVCGGSDHVVSRKDV
jgi:hypothetical protein